MSALLIFVVLVGYEWIYSLRRNLGRYRAKSSVQHLALGIGQSAFNLVCTGASVALYQHVKGAHGAFEISKANPINWVIAIFVTDFFYYLTHRMGHRCNLMAINHLVHHQAPDYNFLSAFRLPWLNRIFVFWIYLPLAWLGFPVEMVLLGFGINSLVATLSHYGLSNARIPILGAVFVAPRSHFVHHGINSPYLDRNFGGIFIFWDRLLGTYQDLVETLPLQLPSDHWEKQSSIRAQFDFWIALWRTLKTKSALGRIKLLFQGPEHLILIMEDPLSNPKGSIRNANPIRVFLYFLVSTVALFGAEGLLKQKIYSAKLAFYFVVVGVCILGLDREK